MDKILIKILQIPCQKQIPPRNFLSKHSACVFSKIKDDLLKILILHLQEPGL